MRLREGTSFRGKLGIAVYRILWRARIVLAEDTLFDE